MKFPLAGVITLLVSLFTPSHSSTGENRAQASPPEMDRKPVVVELFTSEGCSTCPPVDAFLSNLEDQQPIEGVGVVALEEHVDYWNQQGWIDPFSAVEWTERQREYASVFKLDDVYTPQVIVDGQRQFIGGRIQEVVTEIAGAARRSKTDVMVSPEGPAQLTVQVGKLVGITDKNAVEVWLAVTEKGLSSSVSRGENAGKSLHHASVLRTLRRLGLADGKKEPFSFEQKTSVKLKSGWKRDALLAVVFLQERKSRRILGAASTKIAN